MPQLTLFDPESSGSDGIYSVEDVVSLYLRHAAAEGVHCPEAAADRHRTLALFVAVHGSLPVDACKPFHLTDWIESHPTWKSVSTRRAKANYVRAAFQWAANGERIDRNPFSKVRYAEAERRPELADDTFKLIASLANKPFERAVCFLRLTGCRLSELSGATWADVDLERGVWTVQRHKSRKSTGKAKLVALVPEAVDLLRSVAQALAEPIGAAVVVESPEAHIAEPGPCIFLNNRGTPWNRRTLGQQLRRMKARHGIKTRATLHGVRHRFAGQAVANGAPIKLIAAQLGHSTCAVTERYYVDLDGQIDAIREAARLGLPK